MKCVWVAALLRVTFVNMDKQQEIILALAAVCQACTLVKQIATTGKVDEQDFHTSIHSLVITDPDNISDIFGEQKNVRLGYQSLLTQLSHKPFVKDTDVSRYITGILTLERKLARHGAGMEQLGNRIDNIKRQKEHYPLLEPQMLNNLASIYSDVISPMGTKIQVSGEPEFIKQPLIQSKIRALLLSAVRAAVLWRQLGGQRRQIMFKRRNIIELAENTIKQIS